MTDFIVGIFFGVVLAVAINGIIAMTPNSLTYQARKAIAECEATLPRNQTCKLTAIPK